jgi:outer membrane protein OmpA-like peptidoglycan-associated protein
VDNCPDEKGLAEFHGCNEKQLVWLEGTKILGLQPVYFRNDKAVIERASFTLLGEVSKVLLKHPELARVRVEGHTDGNGNRAHNVDLSQRRAEAVMEFLVRQGVPAARLEARGFGPDRPIADNKTPKGRAANRRVVFVIAGGEGSGGE